MSAVDRLAQMWERIEQIEAPAESAPEASFTAIEYSRRLQIAPTTAYNRLNRRVETGVYLSGMRYVQDARGRLTLTRVYWPAEVSNEPDKLELVGRVRGGRPAKLAGPVPGDAAQ